LLLVSEVWNHVRNYDFSGSGHFSRKISFSEVSSVHLQRDNICSIICSNWRPCESLITNVLIAYCHGLQLKSSSCFIFISVSADNDIVFFGRFYFSAENKKVIFGRPLRGTLVLVISLDNITA